ncbi:cation-translocating P-type ATPase [Eubacterium sp. 1001713B170207_170306_E7]|uniref:cation-translocating P-type ATPase n=1 Tax=Eubacterium sp. 1001713B170207_170306_E7 TaxID=2787097 RepID=UPI00189A5742|nr:cation-translocating P-type ATPase [Eubacterium sp. 1001713B170207_170306_E7]
MSKKNCEKNRIKGLSEAEVNQRVQQGRQNRTQSAMTKTTGEIIQKNVFTLFNLMNLLIAIALFCVGAYSNLLFLGIIILNVLIGIAQEIKAKKTVEKLSLLSAPSATVLRGGEEKTITVEEVVQDDIMVLSAGQQICCDAVVISGDVEVNEALLTGEADAVGKTKGGKLLSGSSLVSGQCLARVIHVGGDNYASKIVREAKQVREQSSELMQSMRRVTRITSLFIIPLGIILFLEAFVLRGDPLFTSVVSSAAGLLGMLPKGLVLLISVSLAGGVIKLAKDKILIQDMFSLEALSHVDVLCLDKTGTLTEGKMEVERVWPFENTLAKGVKLESLMGSFLKYSDDNNATFQALKQYFPKSDACALSSRVAFSSERKWTAMTFENGRTLVIGAPERVLQGEMPDGLKSEIKKGRRVLVAGVTEDEVTSRTNLSKTRLIPLAGIVIRDKVRKSAPKILSYFRKQGVTVKVISGDHPATVSTVARDARLKNYDQAIDMTTVGEDVDFSKIAEEYTVFGRTTPQQKKKLVQALKAAGHSVAMTGDGVNDLLALKEADCSIAMGNGSDAARQAAQVVLLASDFSALPGLLLEGRRVVNNVTRAAGVFFIKTIYSVVMTLICVLANIPFPFLPIQITLIDAVIEAYPSFLTAFEADGRRINSRFLPKALSKALPNAAAIIVSFVMVNIITAAGLIEIGMAEKTTVLYLLAGLVSMQAVVKNNRLFTRLRAFVSITMAAGYFGAVFMFSRLLGLERTLSASALLLLGLLLAAAFGVERLLTHCVKVYDRKKQAAAGRCFPVPHNMPQKEQ